MRLRYKAVTKEGKRIEGIIDAKDITEAAVFLRSRAFMPLAIHKQTTQSFRDYLPVFKKTTSGNILLFTRQLGMMITAGLTLLQALQVFKDQKENKGMSEIIQSIIEDIQDGKPFSVSLEKYPEIFSPIYISLVRAGESSGLLDNVLSRLADNLEREQELRRTIKGALLYPVIVVILMVVVVFIMMIFVIPEVSSLYTGFNVELPLPTKIVISLSHFTTTFYPLILISTGLLTFAFYRWHRTTGGKIIMDNFFLKVPIFGKIIQEKTIAETARTLGLLIGTGTLVVKALEQTAAIAGNFQYTTAYRDVSGLVEKGVAMGEAMTSYSVFPPLLTQLVKVGEQTGKLDETLAKASEYFEKEVEQLVKTLTTALEPIILVVLGFGVGFLILSILLPIYNITSAIH